MPRKRALHSRVYSQLQRLPDPIFFSIVVALLMFGILMVFDASVVDAYTQFSDSYYFAKKQIVWMGLGLVSLVITTYIPMPLIKKFAPMLFMISIVLLILVLIPGIGNKVYGARRWISIAGFTLQPSELAKLSVVVYFSSWMSIHQRIEPFLGMLGLVLVLLLLEPDMGTAIIIASIASLLFFMSGVQIKKFMMVMLVSCLLASILILSSEYRRQRVMTFLSPSTDPLGSSYHIRQVIIGLGSGGLTGTGIGQSRQKFQYLPEAASDSIFAVIAEELGFLGSSLVIAAYMALVYRGLSVARRIEDKYAQLISVSVIAWIAIQAILNLASMVVLVPLTGLPLPFISYGGSSMVTVLTAVGLYLNASRYRITQTDMSKLRRRR